MTSPISTLPVTPLEPNMQRLQRLSHMLALACWVLILALPPLFAWFWAVAPPDQVAARINLPTDAVQGPLMLWQRFAGGCISGVPLALLLLGLWHARRCFGLFAGGQIFTLQAVIAMRRFACLATASFASSFLASAVLSTLITFNNRVGTRQLAIGVSTDQVIALFFAGMVWLMAAVIAQGLHLAEENANFV